MKNEKQPFASQFFNSIKNNKANKAIKGVNNPRKAFKNTSKTTFNTPRKLSASVQTLEAFLKPVYKKSDISHLNLSDC
jgi:hypothetical protein